MQTLLDETALTRLHDFGGERLVRGMIELFLRNAPGRAAEAREALECGDGAALRSALHALKSSAGQLGAATIHGACIAGEELAARGDLAECTAHVMTIEADLPLVCQALQQRRVAA